MNKETQRATRKPSMFRMCFHGVCSIVIGFSCVLNVQHLMYNEFDEFYVVASSWAFVGAGLELVFGLREYRKVVDARNQQGSGESPSHNYRHFAKEAELDCFLERRATLNHPAIAQQEKPFACSLDQCPESRIQVLAVD